MLGSHLAVTACRPAAVVPIGPLAWEPPYAASAALKKKKRLPPTTILEREFPLWPSGKESV